MKFDPIQQAVRIGVNVVFTNTQLGVFSLDVVFEKKVSPEAN